MAGANTGAPDSRTMTAVERKLDHLKRFAAEAWKLDPSRRPQARREWESSIRKLEIMSLRHSHDNISANFTHGDKTKSVAETTGELVCGSLLPSDLPVMVAAKDKNTVVVVCGNRRLKALQDACRQGMETKYVDVIVHNLDNHKLGD